MREASYQSGSKRLRSLPEVFTLSGAASVCGMSKKAAAVYISRWTNAGFIEATGPRSGVYFNLIKRPEISAEMRLKALLASYPSAILIGATVLHNAGWTTQIPQRTSIGVISRRSYLDLNGFDVHGRDLSWFETIHGSLLSQEVAEFPTFGLRSLPPALALADLYATKGAWHPDPDDLDIEEDQVEPILAAFDLLKATPPDFLLSENATSLSFSR